MPPSTLLSRLLRALVSPGFSGLANAILRQISPDLRMPIEVAARANTPQWLLKSWAQAFGEANALAIAIAHGSEAPIDITPKTEVAHFRNTRRPDIANRFNPAPRTPRCAAIA